MLAASVAHFQSSKTGTRQPTRKPIRVLRAWRGSCPGHSQISSQPNTSPGSQKGEGHRNVPLQDGWRADPLHHRETSEEPVKGLEQQSKGLRFHQGYLCWLWGLVEGWQKNPVSLDNSRPWSISMGCFQEYMWKWNPQRIRFLILGIYDVLPSLSKLFTWGIVVTLACHCVPRQRPWNISCPDVPKHWMKGATAGGMTKSSRPSLRKLSRGSATAGSSSNIQEDHIHQGRRTLKAEAEALPCESDYLRTGLDDDSWLENQLKIPPHITQTSLRRDITLILETIKQIILLQLNVPWEESRHLEELVEDCDKKGWRSRCIPIEVGCVGFEGQSLSMPYSSGIIGLNRMRAIHSN